MQLTHSRPRKVERTWHKWFNLNFMKLQKYFLCTKKTKIMTFLNNFFSSPSVFATRLCVWYCWHRSWRWTFYIAVYRGLESSRIPLKASPLVFWRWMKVLRVWNIIRVSNCDPFCEIQDKVSKYNYEITSIKVWFHYNFNLWDGFTQSLLKI